MTPRRFFIRKAEGRWILGWDGTPYATYHSETAALHTVTALMRHHPDAVLLVDGEPQADAPIAHVAQCVRDEPVMFEDANSKVCGRCGRRIERDEDVRRIEPKISLNGSPHEDDAEALIVRSEFVHANRRDCRAR